MRKTVNTNSAMIIERRRSFINMVYNGGKKNKKNQLWIKNPIFEIRKFLNWK